jgi:hypothetical protein
VVNNTGKFKKFKWFGNMKLMKENQIVIFWKSGYTKVFVGYGLNFFHQLNKNR